MLVASLLVALSFHSVELPGDEWNPIHLGVDLAYDLPGSATDLMGGAYRNSLGRLSVYGGVRFALFAEAFDGRLHAEAGLVSGYDGGALLPMARVSYVVAADGPLELFVMPAATLDRHGALLDVGVAAGVQITSLRKSFR